MELKNHRHELFCRKFVELGNQAEAYSAAGYSCPNAKAAAANASRLIANDSIRKRIQEIQSKLWAKLDKKAEVMLQENFNHAFADIGEIFERSKSKLDGYLKLKDISKLPPETRRLIAGLKIRVDGTVEVKLVDKQKAIEIALRSQGALTEKHQVEFTDETSGNELNAAHRAKLQKEISDLRKQLQLD